MDARVGQPAPERAESSIADLFAQLADDGRELVRAEANLYKKIALHRASKASGGAIALVAGALLLNAALITLLVAFALGLTPHVGPVLAGLIVAVVASLIAFVLIRLGLAKMKSLSGDEEEKAALAAGERLA